jgi:hypothetical protein
MDAEAEAAAAALRQAVALIAQHAPAGFENDVREIRRRVGWIVAGLDDTRTCERCDERFTFDAVRYARERMPAPRNCPSCKRQR